MYRRQDMIPMIINAYESANGYRFQLGHGPKLAVAYNI
jgi:hypothetical protein